MPDWGRGARGAGGGAAAGSMFGPIGTGIGALGGFLGGLSRGERRPDNWDHNIANSDPNSRPQFGDPNSPHWEAYLEAQNSPGGAGSWEDFLANAQNVAVMREDLHALSPEGGSGGGMPFFGKADRVDPFKTKEDPSSLEDPGAGERAYHNQQDWFTEPTETNQYWNQVSGAFNNPTNVSNRAEEAYQDFRGSGLTAGLDPFYDEARRRTSEDINAELAARGMHGSSAGMSMLGEALGGLSAEQANREGDFRLAAYGLGGQLGRGADISSYAQNQNELNWLRTGGELAGQADSSELARRGLGLDAAFSAQGAEEGRILGGLDRQIQMDQFNTAMAMDQYNRMIETLMGLTDAAIAPQNTIGPMATNQESARNESMGSWVDRVLSFGKGLGFLN